ncbi:unnamed protein product [Lactuca virosa]|uniref:LTI65/LTI78 PGEED repeat domain-containing protein n=1 Tax=Lactuca virosa TaxID=75947 RepID=A0AAU9N675_9ASTR|nr:unnamed protein product [Lactuca virosa]
MAQANDIEKTSNAQSGQQVQNVQHIKSTSKAQTSSTFQQLLQREGSKWSHISTEKLKKNKNQEHNGNDHNKKSSVLAKVKEKAKKLKHSLSIKKHRHENDPPSTSVTCNAITSSEDKGGENAEFHSPRMSTSKHIPDTNKQEARDHPREAHIPITEKHSPTSKDEPTCSSNTIKNSHSKNGELTDDANHQVTSTVGAHNDVNNQAATTADAAKENDLPESSSRFSNLTVSTAGKDERSTEEGENMKTWERGVSVKEYLLQKFEPGEDERALSQIITQTISPRRDKVREAMSSFLKTEEPSESTSKISNSEVNDNDTNPNNLKTTKSLPASVNTESKIASIVQSHSLGSNASKNLNQTFKSTVASYQNNLNSSANTSSSPKSSSSPLGHGVSSPESSNAHTTRVPPSKNLLGAVEE